MKSSGTAAQANADFIAGGVPAIREEWDRALLRRRAAGNATSPLVLAGDCRNQKIRDWAGEGRVATWEAGIRDGGSSIPLYPVAIVVVDYANFRASLLQCGVTIHQQPTDGTIPIIAMTDHGVTYHELGL